MKSKQVPGYRPRVPAVVWYCGTGVVAVAAVTCAFVFSQAPAPAPAPAQHPVAAPHPPVHAGFHLGVFKPGETENYRPVEKFATAVGREPDLVLYYSGWGEPFLTKFAETAYAHGAEPLVQLYPPAHAGLAWVASGKGDRFLRSYAAQARAFGHRVIVSFAPEPNGPWYRWGWTHTPAATWVKAWRHVVTVFRAAGATNVTWLWTMNIAFTNSGPPADYWPGSSYVDWVGIDGYYVRPGDTFKSLFMSTVRAVRRLTSKPMLVSEASVGPASGQLRGIRNLFAAIRRYNLTGLVWFDERQHRGVYHQDWRLEDNPAAVALFRREARSYGRPLPPAESGK